MLNLNNSVLSRGVLMEMVRILTKQRRGINVCHINAQSLNNKIDEFRLTFENSGVDIICVSETWLNKNTPDSLISLRGYKVYRADRITLGGGVAIFVKQGLKCKLVSKSAEEDRIEHIFVELIANDRNLLVGCVYRPYGNISLQNFNEKLETIAVEFSDVIIAGDFNSNLLVENALQENMAVFGLSATNTSMPTHFTTMRNTLLDVFFVDNISKVKLYDQLSASCFSKHDLIFLSYEYCVESDAQTYTFRDFINVNYNIIHDDMMYSNLYRIYSLPSVDEQLSLLEDNLANIYDQAVPLKTRTKRFNSRPWFNPRIKHLIRKRNLAYARWKRFKTESFKEEFRCSRKEVNNEIKRAKCEYFSRRFSRSIDTKETWKTIREIGHCVASVPDAYSVSANEINKSFINIPTVHSNKMYYRDLLVEPGRSANTFQYSCVYQDDVFLSCMAVKSNAIGYDNINPKFVKIILPQILPFVTHLFNTIIMSGNFPSRWRHAKIIPLPKTKTEFRPIAILPYFSKVLEKIMSSQMNSHLVEHNYLSNYQSGFRSKHSCITALIDVAENIRSDIDEGKIEILVLLDHSKAFDTVDHDILCLKLKYIFNYSSTAIKLIRSYLGNRSQSVFLNGDISDPLPVTRGVPQGSILGPLLFSCYANDLPQRLVNCKLHMYADDVQIYLGTTFCSFEEAVSKVNYDLQIVHDWASANGLCINPRKSKCLVIHGRTRKYKFDTNISLNGQKIEIVDSVKNLGIIFNNTLTWSNHVNSVAGATYNKLRALWSTQAYTPQRIRLLLAKAYIMPTLFYGCEVYSSCDSRSSRRLNVVFNNICRYVYGIGKYEHISNFNTKLYGMPLDSLFKFRVLQLLHKIIYAKTPPYLFDRLRFTISNRGNMLVPLKHRTLVSDWQFYIHAIRLWNTLPHSVQTNSNATRFKRLLNDHISNIN